MSNPEESPQADQAAVTEELPLIGVYDIVILTVLIGGALYWFFGRKKKDLSEDGTAFKPYSIAPVNGTVTADTGFIQKMKASGRNVVVFYGSQTGTAEEFAGRLAKEASRYGMKGMVADPEESEMEDLSRLSEIENSLAIFCMATYGEGDPTDNAQQFYEWLQGGDVDLSGVKYVVFGLGNKTYEHYNSMGIYVDKRLEELGAERVFELGLGDDDANLEEDFISWKERFWPVVCEHFGLDTTGQDINMRQYRLVVHDDVVSEKIYTGEVARLNSYKTQRPPFDPKNPFLATIVVNRELHKGGDRSCMHIEIDLGESKIRYESGDHVAIYPKNDETLVVKIGELLNTDLDQTISLVSLDEDSHRKHPFPCPCTFRTALLYYLDITSTPYTHVLKEIADYATDPVEQHQLKTMGSNTPEGKVLYSQFIVNSNRNIVHVLEDFSSLKPTLDHLCELLPRLQARYYSISSSPKLYPQTIHITAVLVEYETPTKRRNRGVATGWLNKLQPKASESITLHVPVFVRKSQFRLPAQPQTPIIMIGPGTGLAPFRGFIQERKFQKDQGKPVGDTVLYFGCRARTHDYLYEEELKEYVETGVITKLYTAFSREQAEKIYVTNLLQKNSDEVWDIIGNKNGHIYICGDARNMARDVLNIIKTIFIQKGGMTEADAAAYLKKMEFQKRYSADVWS